jgi:hypothetical protein
MKAICSISVIFALSFFSSYAGENDNLKKIIDPTSFIQFIKNNSHLRKTMIHHVQSVQKSYQDSCKNLGSFMVKSVAALALAVSIDQQSYVQIGIFGSVSAMIMSNALCSYYFSYKDCDNWKKVKAYLEVDLMRADAFYNQQAIESLNIFLWKMLHTTKVKESYSEDERGNFRKGPVTVQELFFSFDSSEISAKSRCQILVDRDRPVTLFSGKVISYEEYGRLDAERFMKHMPEFMKEH